MLPQTRACRIFANLMNIKKVREINAEYEGVHRMNSCNKIVAKFLDIARIGSLIRKTLNFKSKI